MYAKVFSQIYDGTLCTRGPWQALVTFQQMLVLADLEGNVDMTAGAISRRTTIPLDIIEMGISSLVLPDPESRTPTEEGRRIVRLAEGRSWGWRIVNYAQYRDLKKEEDRREYHREYWRKHRSTASTETQHTQPIQIQDKDTAKEASKNAEPLKSNGGISSPPDPPPIAKSVEISTDSLRRREEVLSEVCRILGETEVSDQAKDAQMTIAHALKGAQFSVQTEIGVSDRGDGCSGRVDIMAAKDGVDIAIELDRMNPRKKSIDKLLSTGGVRVVGLRGGASKRPPPGIDAVVGMRLTGVPKRPAPGSETWEHYSKAYSSKYGVAPVRNQKTNSQVAQLVKRLGASEAPFVAEHYLTHRHSLYVSAKHCLDLLVRDAEKLRTEWATGTQGTHTQALMADKTQTNFNSFAPLIEAARRKEANEAE